MSGVDWWRDHFSVAETDHLFLNQYSQPISTRGVQKLVTKSRLAAGITKRAGSTLCATPSPA